ncbi:MAG: polyprenyl synthetase family protein [Thermoplasmata archaeon]|nr:polyprenyl synthetase family protein [Euryarchaeota archaeon]RLF67331.1 MAG: polyprenyl synthetase family protein [Thermoplasmata archaeon]
MDEESVKRIIKDLTEVVNKSLDDILQIKDPKRFYEAVRWLPMAGGKRLRPIIAIVVARMLGAELEKVLPFALALELTHNFTLVHDDIIDEDEFRRGVPTVHMAFDVPTAIIAGDTLFAIAYRELSKLKIDGETLREILRDFSQMVIELAEGEYEDVEFEKREDVSLEEYVEMIRKKTARIIQTACYGAALISGLPKSKAEILGKYGLNIGLAFQIQDDILGLIGDPKVTGKPVGSDIRKGKKTILIIHAMNNLKDDKKKELMEILRKEKKTDEDVNRAVELIRSAGSIEYAKEKAREYSKKAMELLKEFPNNEYKEVLKYLANYVVERVK